MSNDLTCYTTELDSTFGESGVMGLKPILERELISISDAARRLDVSYHQAWLFVNSGRLPHVQLGEYKFVPIGCVNSLNKDREKNPPKVGRPRLKK